MRRLARLRRASATAAFSSIYGVSHKIRRIPPASDRASDRPPGGALPRLLTGFGLNQMVAVNPLRCMSQVTRTSPRIVGYGNAHSRPYEYAVAQLFVGRPLARAGLEVQGGTVARA
jgi:hypothetical protein